MDTANSEGSEMVTISLKLPRELKKRIDQTWEERMFPNRSEFLRQALRDAVQPERQLSAEALDAIRQSAGELEAGETINLEDLESEPRTRD